MKSVIKALALFVFLFTSWVQAHPTHEKEQTIFKDQAVDTATYHIKRLVKKGKLDESWEKDNVVSAMLELRDSRQIWIVSYTKSKQGNDNKTLYIFLTKTGYFISTNFTGK